MPDIAAISSLLSSVKTATEIAKFVKDSEISIQNAEVKLKMAELISALADVKIEIANLQHDLIEKDGLIVQLESALQKKASTKFDGTVYWIDGDSVPFCTVCLEKDSKHHHLKHIPKSDFGRERWACNVCKNTYPYKIT